MEQLMNDTLRIYYSRHDSFDGERTNTHVKHYEINYCLDGAVDYIFSGHKFSLIPKGMVLIPKRTEHSYQSKGGHDGCSIGFTHSFIEPSFVEKHFSYNILDIFKTPYFDFATSPYYYNRIELLLKKMIHNRTENAVSCIRLRNDLLELLLTIKEFSEQSAHKYTKIGEIDSICGYIHKNYYHNIDLKSIAEDYAIHYGYLSTIFKQKTGMAFKQYLNEVRLNKSAELLENSQMSIASICFECGFNDLAHYYRLFRKRFGKTPQKHRKSHLKS